jgi:hypothetical protein
VIDVPKKKRGGRGSAPGERRGGRQKGTLNKRTVAKIMEASDQASAALRSGKKLAMHVLDDFMQLTAGMAAHYQPAPPGAPANPHANEQKFWHAVEHVRDFAKALAPYQSPTFKAIAVVAPPSQDLGMVPTASGSLPRPQGENVIDLTDAEQLTRVYKRRIAGVG